MNHNNNGYLQTVIKFAGEQAYVQANITYRRKLDLTSDGGYRNGHVFVLVQSSTRRLYKIEGGKAHISNIVIYLRILSKDISSPLDLLYEPPHGKTNNLHRQKQRRRSASQ